MLAAAFKNTDWKWTAIAASSVVASPLIWNIIARNEVNNKTLTKIMGSPRKGCYALAVWIFASSLVRDKMIDLAIQHSKPSSLIPEDIVKPAITKACGIGMMAGGMILVGASYYRLGIAGTYLGDYFGILMDSRVTEFPYNVFRDPMYTGATLGFLGLAAYENSPVGVLLSGWVWLVYEISTGVFENPYTTKIYEEAAAKKKQ